MNRDFKCGDMVVFISDDELYRHSLILYKIYIVIRVKMVSFDFVILTIMTEDGHKTGFLSKDFKLLEDYRTDIINEILK